MAKRVKTQAVLPPKTKEELEVVMAEYATAHSKIEQITSSMDQEIIKIREANAAELQKLTAESESSFKKVQMYAETHPELFEKKKSHKMSQGVIGFRSGTHKILQDKGISVSASLLLLKKSKLGKTYIELKESVKKARLIADREDQKVVKLISDCGMKLTKDEGFYIDLDKEKVDA